MSASSTDSASTAQDLPVPDYLQGKSYDDKEDRPAFSALNIHATGRLSLRPCRLVSISRPETCYSIAQSVCICLAGYTEPPILQQCVADGKDCIVSPTKSSRCAWCSFKSMKIRQCHAEGVKFVDPSERRDLLI